MIHLRMCVECTYSVNILMYYTVYWELNVRIKDYELRAVRNMYVHIQNYRVVKSVCVKRLRIQSKLVIRIRLTNAFNSRYMDMDIFELHPS